MQRSVSNASKWVVGATAAAFAVMSFTPAFANPSNPATVTIAGVGSDTTQGVMNAYAAAYNKASKSTYPGVVGSYDATGTAKITTKKNCVAITRPDGSGAGITALRNDTTGCIDFARSSRSKKTDGTENNLTFFGYGLDAVSVGTIPATKGTLTPGNVDITALKKIYTCQVRDWHTISSKLPHSIIHPYLPQTGSGTRSFFLGAISLDDSKVGACVKQVQENTGTALKGDRLGIEPYSVAVWLSQASKVNADKRGGVVLRSINGRAPIVKNAINPSFTGTFRRVIFNVVRTSDATKFAPLFGSAGFICKNQAIVAKYGFGKLGSGCGTKF